MRVGANYEEVYYRVHQNNIADVMKELKVYGEVVECEWEEVMKKMPPVP